MRTTRDANNPAAIGALSRGDLENFLVASTPGGIEAQEKAGQLSFVKASILPQNCPRAELEILGFKFGDNVDDLFVSVTFPPGWEKTASNHSMWSDLVDDKGRRRGGVFYKAAFYDRKAHLRLNPRYQYYVEYPEGWGGDTPLSVLVKDNATGEVLFSVADIERQDYKAEGEALETCRTWLTENFPDWERPSAYWENNAA